MTIQTKKFEENILKMINQLYMHLSINLYVSLCDTMLLTKSIGMYKFKCLYPMCTIDMTITRKKKQFQINQYIWSPAAVENKVRIGDIKRTGLCSIDEKCKRQAPKLPGFCGL